jgi:hypothetical protein
MTAPRLASIAPCGPSPVGPNLNPDVASILKDAEGAQFATLQALLATGASEWEALGLLAVVAPDWAIPRIEATMAKDGFTFGTMDACDQLAAGCPAAANAALGAALRGGQARSELHSLNVSDCSWLAGLPGGLVFPGSVGFANCPNLTVLPKGLTVGMDLMVNDCPALASLPGDLRVGRHLHLASCVGLTTLAAGIRVGEDLHLTDCLALDRLPDDLDIGGWLSLRGCAHLRALPVGLKVGQGFDLRGCSAWDGRLPCRTPLNHEIVTDAWPTKMSVDRWRWFNPNGEVRRRP